jgi:hypothetical protein
MSGSKIILKAAKNQERGGANFYDLYPGGDICFCILALECPRNYKDVKKFLIYYQPIKAHRVSGSFNCCIFGPLPFWELERGRRSCPDAGQCQKPLHNGLFVCLSNAAFKCLKG